MADRHRPPELRYRIVCYELSDDEQTVILDATAQGFIAVTGTIADDGTMRGEGTHAGPLELQRRLARLIAEDEQLAGLTRTRPPARSVRGSPYRSPSPISDDGSSR